MLDPLMRCVSVRACVCMHGHGLCCVSVLTVCVCHECLTTEIITANFSCRT